MAEARAAPEAWLAERSSRLFDGFQALAALSEDEWTEVLVALAAASRRDDERRVVARRLGEVAPALAEHAGRLLAVAVDSGANTQGDPPWETAEALASHVWSELGGERTAVLAGRLDSLLAARLVLRWAAPIRYSRASGVPDSLRQTNTTTALGLLADLPADEWEKAVAVLHASPGAPAHEIYARFTLAAPTMRWTYAHRLLYDLIHRPSSAATRPEGDPADELMATGGDRDPAEDILVRSRLNALLATPWIARRRGAARQGR